MKYLLALWLSIAAPLTYAACSTHNYCGPNGCIYCTTCCFGSNCTTNCY